MKPLRMAVIGCGAVSTEYHLPALRRVKQTKLVVVVDTDCAWARTVARRFGADRCLSDYRDLVGQVDAAVIATPNTTHADIACFLLERGVHVLCEKPLATSVADAQRIVHAAETGNARFMAAHTRRFNAALCLMQRITAAGLFGKRLEVSASLGGLISQWAARTDFRAQRTLAGGGVLLDSGVHLVDLALWLVQDMPQEIMCKMSDPLGWGVEGDAEVEIRFQQSSRARLACSYTHPLNGTVTVEGEHGWARAGINKPDRLEFYSAQALVCRRSGVQHPLLSAGNVYDLQSAHFCTALQKGQPFRVPLNEVLTGLEVIEQCYASALPLTTASYGDY